MKLKKYQERIIAKLEQRQHTILAVGMGLGKTAAVVHYIDRVRPMSVLIVAPKRVAETVWQEEAEKWGLPSASKYIKIQGKPAQRKAALTDTSHPYKIISRELLRDVVGQSFSVLVIDELTTFKTPTSQRSQYINRIYAVQRIGLTGTFLANGAVDVFGQAAAVGLERNNIITTKRGYTYSPTFNAWRDTYFVDVMANSGQKFHKWQPVFPLKAILEPYNDHIFTLDRNDYLEIPDVSYVQHKIELSEQEQRNYVQLSATCSVSLEDDVMTVNEQAKFAKLQTLCNGFIYDENGIAHRGEVSSKLDAVATFVEDCIEENEPVLLFYAYREEAIWIAETLSARGITFASTKDTENIQKWLRGEISVLVAHPASAGHGLNLQAGGRICVWSSVTYNYEFWAQANARLARQGQDKKVQIHIFTAADTIEEKQLKAVVSKEKTDREFIRLTK